MIRILLLSLCLCGSAAAETLPALFSVTGVAQDDVLNIRAAPDAGASQIGQLDPDATGVEVVALSRDGRWGQVNTWEWAGWVSMRYLVREPGPDWTAMQTPLKCHGTEPFWSMNVDPLRRTVSFELMGETRQSLRIDQTAPVSGRSGMVGWRVEGAATDGFASLQTQSCSDGMSDRLLGIAIAVFLSGADGMTGYSGCCTLQP